MTEAPGLPRPQTPGSLAPWAWLAIAAALATIGLKTSAYLMTGSVGLLADALESGVNLLAGILALIALTIAARPADRNHHFGHGKVEYLSAGAEGVMILIAAVLIVVTAVQRLLNPVPLEAIGVGLVITMVATIINGVVGTAILRAGRRHRSITLVADGKHLLTDVWTSVGVVVGVGLVALSGWLALDSLVAIAVGLNIVWTGFGLIRHAVHGLMDHAMSAEDEALVVAAIATLVSEYPRGEVAFHGLQTRESGRERFVSMHVLVPGAWSLMRAHDVAERVEASIGKCLPGVMIQTHLEPLEDPRAYGDVGHGHTGLDTQEG